MGTDDNASAWRALWRTPRSRLMLGVPVGAVLFFIAGIVFLGAVNWSMELSNSEAFCVSCHEMRDFVYEEYKSSLHYKNASGTRATCSDCHVPKQWYHKVVRKVSAGANDVYHKILGSIDTQEKFEAKRLIMAERIWADMRATDSRECRNCHALVFMNLAEQDKSARKKHTLERAQEKDETCIDCHQGVAHKLPKDYE